MKKTRFSEEQIIAVLREQEGGMKTADVCRKHGISSATLYAWKAKYGGLDVSDALSLNGHTAAIPRVALSADVMPDQISEARQRGFVEYLTKPLDVGKLLSLLDRCARGDAL